MATATTKASVTTFVLELSEKEAIYVVAALMNTHPSDGSDDTVFDALISALDRAGVELDGGAAEYFG